MHPVEYNVGQTYVYPPETIVKVKLILESDADLRCCCEQDAAMVRCFL